MDVMGSDLSVVRGARISNGAAMPEWRGAPDAKLIRFLAEHNHTSPFEHCTATFYVKAPIFVIREWMRHRTLSYNEMSARYKELRNEFWYPDQVRGPDPNNKQGSIPVDYPSLEHVNILHLDDTYRMAWDSYVLMLDDGVAREIARAVLPVAIYSEMYVTGNLLNWAKFYDLRSSDAAQQEIREYANQIGAALLEKFPLSFTALTKPYFVTDFVTVPND